MSRGFVLTFQSLSKNTCTFDLAEVEHLMSEMKYYKHPVFKKATSLNALIGRLPPAQDLRRRKLETERRLNQEKVEMMISKYFSDRLVLEPPESLKDMKEMKDGTIKNTIRKTFFS
mmetsp:Transcript_2119/g.5244  ORF Transcript_2119/g.5244 Transcript_2119/m.5244 type:complete len:116 (+) Transcript_2119:407-754(+)